MCSGWVGLGSVQLCGVIRLGWVGFCWLDLALVELCCVILC